MLYEKLMSAWKACDISSWRSCYHEDYTFVSHANGTTMSASDMSDEMMLGMMQTTTLENNAAYMKMKIFLSNIALPLLDQVQRSSFGIH